MSVCEGFVLQLLPLGYLSTVPTYCLSARIVVTACTSLHALHCMLRNVPAAHTL